MSNTSISRMPNPAEFVPELSDISAALFRATGNHSVSRSTVSLVHLRAGQIVGNTYLTILNTSFLRKAGESEERITAVSSWQDAPYFTDAERAALALAEALTRIADRPDPVTDEIWNDARKHFDEQALSGILLSIAGINVWNRLNVATRQVAASAGR